MKAVFILILAVLAQCSGSVGSADEPAVRTYGPLNPPPAKPLTDFRCSPNNPAWLCKFNPRTQCVEIYCTSGEHRNNPELREIVCDKET